LNWDSQLTTLNSYYNVQSLVSFTSATAATATLSVSCGTNDLLSSASTAAANKGNAATACV